MIPQSSLNADIFFFFLNSSLLFALF